MIERRGFCNRCGLCELGREPDENGNPVGDATLVVWDPTKRPGEEEACYHRLIRDLLNGRPLAEVRAEWMEVEPTFDGDIAAYRNFPARPEAVLEGCNYRFYKDDQEISLKQYTNGQWSYPEYTSSEPIILNDRRYGES